MLNTFSRDFFLRYTLRVLEIVLNKLDLISLYKAFPLFNNFI